MDTQVNFRFAKRQDVPLILKFIRELAEYEKMFEERLYICNCLLMRWCSAAMAN